MRGSRRSCQDNRPEFPVDLDPRLGIVSMYGNRYYGRYSYFYSQLEPVEMSSSRLEQMIASDDLHRQISAMAFGGDQPLLEPGAFIASASRIARSRVGHRFRPGRSRFSRNRGRVVKALNSEPPGLSRRIDLPMI